MASNGRNILNTAMGIHNSAVSTYGQLDSATKKFQNKKHSKSIIKSAKDNIFEFPVFVSSSVPMDYATATNTLLEQCYASYLQMAITAQGPVISATEARNGTQFAKFKSDTNKYLECVEMQYAHDACHNLIQEADYSIEFSLLSYEDSDARIINEHVDYQPLSEFNHFFQEEVIPEDDVDWDWLYYMEATTNRPGNNQDEFDGNNVLLPYPELVDFGNGMEVIVDMHNNIDFTIENGHFKKGTMAEIMDYLQKSGISHEDSVSIMNSIQRQARSRGISVETPARIAQLQDENYNRLWEKTIREISNVPVDKRYSDAKKSNLSKEVSQKIKNAETDLGISDGTLENVIKHLYENDELEMRRQSINTCAQFMRNMETQVGNGIDPSKEQQELADNLKDYGAMSSAELIQAAQQARRYKELQLEPQKYEKDLHDLAKLDPKTTDFSKFAEEHEGWTADAAKKAFDELNAKRDQAGAGLDKTRIDAALQAIHTMKKDDFLDKYGDIVSEKNYNKIKATENAERTSKTSRAEVDKLNAAREAIKSGEDKYKAAHRIGISNTQADELEKIVNREKRTEEAQLTSAEFKALMDGVRSGKFTASSHDGYSDTEFENAKRLNDISKQSESAKSESDRLKAITDKIRAGAKSASDASSDTYTCTADEFNAIKAIINRENDQASVRLSYDRFKAITDKIDRGVDISATEANDAGLDVKTIKNMQDLAKVRHDIEKHNEEILKRQAEKTKGYYRALDDIKTTADAASSIGQAVATGTRAAKEIATFKSDVSIKKSQAEEAKSKAEMTKTESELKKKQLRDYEKDKDLERRVKEQEIEKSKQNIETAKHQMKMAEKNAKMTEQQVRNSSKTEGPKFIDETKIQKLNSLKPMLMSVDLRVIDDIGGLSTPVQYIVGVKTHSRMIDAEILPEVAEYPLKKMDEISRKAKWRAGELKFLKDIVFKIDEKKQTAADKKDPRRNWYRRLYDLAHMKGDAPAAKVAEGKSLFETYFKDKIGKSKAITGVIPNASIVITQADVNNIKAQTKINLLKGSSARKFCKELFLLGFVIIDDDAESVKCMFPDLHNDFEVHSLASIKKQVSMLDTAGTKTKDMFKLLG
jgi:hypothetical protein